MNYPRKLTYMEASQLQGVVFVDWHIILRVIWQPCGKRRPSFLNPVVAAWLRFRSRRLHKNDESLQKRRTEDKMDGKEETAATDSSFQAFFCFSPAIVDFFFTFWRKKMLERKIETKPHGVFLSGVEGKVEIDSFQKARKSKCTKCPFSCLSHLKRDVNRFSISLKEMRASMNPIHISKILLRVKQFGVGFMNMNTFILTA